MIELDFEIRRMSEATVVDWTWANETLLRYDSFLGDIRFVVGDYDLSMDWGWVPVFDFSLSLRSIIRQFPQNASAVFDFTESGDTIEFILQKRDALRVQSSYVEGIGVAGLDEFREVSSDFMSRVRRSIEREVPEILTNRHYVDALNRAS